MRDQRNESAVNTERGQADGGTHVRSDSSLSLSASSPIHVSWDRMPSPTEPRYDMHYGVELGIVLTGRMRRFYRRWQTVLGAGEVWFAGTWERHGWAVEEAPCEVLVFVMLPHVLAHPEPVGAVQYDWLASFAVPPEQRPRVTPEARPQILALVRQLRAKMNTGGRLREAWIRLLVLETLALLRSGWAAPKRPALTTHFGGGVGKAVELVFSSRRLVTMEEAARACSMSGRTFRRAFDRLMGISFARFALRYRLSGATAQLLRTDDPLKVIALAWGFNDASHLHRCFVRHYRCTPQRYRQRAAAASAETTWRGTPGCRPRGRSSGKRGSDA